MRKSVLVAALVVIFFLTLYSFPARTRFSDEEGKELAVFFNYLLFENFGAYVLFGSKPMCEAFLPPDLTPEEWTEKTRKIPESVLKKGKFVQSDFSTEWRTWEKAKSRLPLRRFRILFGPKSIVLLDLRQVQAVLKGHEPFFREVLGGFPDIAEIERWDSPFWQNIRSNHKALGLLFGYGWENVCYFESPFRDLSQEHDEPDAERPSADAFGIPEFATPMGSPRVLEFQAERERIREMYRGKDMLETTLQRLIAE